MIPNIDYGQTLSSGNMATGQASIELSPAMFNILSNQIYSDKVLAVIREPLCNARDAQVECGADKPIEIHLPSSLEPFFHVRDYGNGLSQRQICGYYEPRVQFNSGTGDKETVQEFVPGLYLRYGLSTKTDSNDQIGGLGIGCKSPLAYSDSFIVESYQDGTCKTYSVYKENGMPQVSKLAETLTTEANGLKVKLAVKDGDNLEFARKANQFLQFFGYPFEIKGSTLGYSFNQPDPILETDLYNTYSSTWETQGKVSVLMGGVVYSLTTQHCEQLASIVKTDYMVMLFNIGDLTVAASREGLSEDPQTIAAIESRITEITESFYSDVISQVDACDTEYEAYHLLKKYDLFKRGWNRNSRQVEASPAAGAEALLVRGGLTIADFIAQVTCKYRVVRSRTGSGKSSSYKKHVTDLDLTKLVYLRVDKKVGYLKVAHELAKAGGDVVLLESPGDKQELEAFFGPIVTKEVSVEYPIMFPKVKGATTIKVAASGLRTYLGDAVGSIKADQKGYYIPFIRNTCLMKGVNTLGLSSRDENGIIALVRTLVQGELFSKDEVFYSRKAGMPAIKKTELKELTADAIIDKIKDKVTQQDLDVFTQFRGEPSGSPLQSRLSRLWEEVRGDYPLHDKTGSGGTGTKQNRLLSDLPLAVIHRIAPDYSKNLETVVAAYEVERALIKKDHALARSIPSWEFNQDLVDELIEFSRFKRDQLNTKREEINDDF